jgi:hypothetical protein
VTVVTWIAVVVLGVGSLAVFGFFLRDLSGVLPGSDNDEAIDNDGPPTQI